MSGRTKKALAIALRYGGIDGDHHKAWVIDQMVRALTGCPMVPKRMVSDGKPYTYDVQGESKAYAAFVAEARIGDDGPDTYEWWVGVAP